MQEILIVLVHMLETVAAIATMICFGLTIKIVIITTR